MSRERDAIELIWECLAKVKEDAGYSYKSCYWNIEQILTQMEDLIQEDLEQMERSCRSRVTLEIGLPLPPGKLQHVACPSVEELKKSQEA